METFPRRPYRHSNLPNALRAASRAILDEEADTGVSAEEAAALIPEEFNRAIDEGRKQLAVKPLRSAPPPSRVDVRPAPRARPRLSCGEQVPPALPRAGTPARLKARDS